MEEQPNKTKPGQVKGLRRTFEFVG
jgi:hypothetical protein